MKKQKPEINQVSKVSLLLSSRMGFQIQAVSTVSFKHLLSIFSFTDFKSLYMILSLKKLYIVFYFKPYIKWMNLDLGH